MEFGTIIPSAPPPEQQDTDDFENDDVEFFTSKAVEKARRNKRRVLSVGFCLILLAVTIGLTVVTIYASTGSSYANVNDPFELLKIFININSVSGNEKEFGIVVQDWLKPRGWNIIQQEVTPTSYNIFAYGDSRNPSLVLVTHLDTIPNFFNFSEDDTKIYGRGATDPKGVMVSMLFAIEQLRSENLIDNSKLGFLFVAGEEAGSTGMTKALELNLTPKFVLMGQPTKLKLASGIKGATSFLLQSYGEERHSGYPQFGDSAIIPLIEILRLLDTEKWPVDSFFGATTINVGTIYGGIAPNVIPGYANATVLIRNTVDSSIIVDQVNAIVGNNLTVTWLSQNDPFKCDLIPGFDSEVFSFGSNLPNLPGNHKSYIFGPGSVLDSHTSSEFILKAAVTTGITKYKTLILDILAQD